jgi:hypothetical protein
MIRISSFPMADVRAVLGGAGFAALRMDSQLGLWMIGVPCETPSEAREQLAKLPEDEATVSCFVLDIAEGTVVAA